MKISSHASRHGPWLFCSLVMFSALVLVERCGTLWGKSILNITIPAGQTGFPITRRLTPLVSSPLFAPLRGLLPEPAYTNPVCETLRWLPPTSLTPEGGELECNNEKHCSFVFRNACIQRNQSFQGGAGGYKWLVEVAEGCDIPDPPTRECLLESGPSRDPMKVLYAEGGQKVEPREGGFDPMPTVMLDRSGGMPGNFWHDTSISFYPLFQNMRLCGLDNYEGYRIAVIDGYGMPSSEKKGLDELYFVHNPTEFTDWRDFADRKCFRELTLMRTSFKWQCRTHVVAHNLELNRYSDLVAKHFGVTGERAPLPENPSLFFLYRGGNRKLLNWDELAGSLDIPYVVHDMSASWREQIEAVRNASIIFGLHGAGHSLLLHAPLGAVVIEVHNHGRTHDRMFRNQAVASGRFYMKHIIRDEKAIHRASPFGEPMDDPITYHYADMEVARKDFHMLLDTAFQILSAETGKPLYSEREF